jgi:organic hydroperoxide reductase OsmC/OhrA
MMKLDISKARVKVRGEFQTSGSVFAGTIRSGCKGITTELEVESSSERDKVLHMLRQAENGCYAEQSLRNPVEVKTTVTLNGEPVTP